VSWAATGVTPGVFSRDSTNRDRAALPSAWIRFSFSVSRRKSAAGSNLPGWKVEWRTSAIQPLNDSLPGAVAPMEKFCTPPPNEGRLHTFWPLTQPLAKPFDFTMARCVQVSGCTFPSVVKPTEPTRTVHSSPDCPRMKPMPPWPLATTACRPSSFPSSARAQASTTKLSPSTKFFATV
jgi:hypothetical protein